MARIAGLIEWVTVSSSLLTGGNDQTHCEETLNSTAPTCIVLQRAIIRRCLMTSITPTQASIPVLPGLPVLGNLLELRYNRLELLLRVGRECGDIGSFRLGQRRVILVSSSELAQAVLVEHAPNFEKTPTLRVGAGPLIGNGLLTSENEFHKRQRKLVAPAFQHRRIASYADVMANYTERLQGEWTDGQRIDIAHEMMRLTLRIVGKILFDVDVLGKADELGEALTISMRHFIGQASRLVHIFDTWPTPHNRRAIHARSRLNATVYQIIEERRRSSEDRGDLLSMLLRARDEDDGSFMNDTQVHDESMTLFLAGHETTANALAWSWYLLSRHQDIYTHMCEEVDSILHGRLPEVTDLPNLPYTLRVFKESMRLYPPAYMIGRQAVHPVDLLGYHIPAKGIVFISPYAMHRRADYFHEPERFNPDRFTPEMEQRLPRYAYMPFGGGPRICIGNHFAMMEGHLILATLAQYVTFEFTGQHPVKTEPLVTLRPKGGIPMLVHRR